MPHDEVPALLAAADICLVPLCDVPLFSTFIPAKMFEYLAAGKAVVGALAREAAQILEEAGAVVVPPEDGVALADATRALADDPERRQLLGKQGRAYVEQRFNRAALAREYRKIISMVARRRRSGRPTRHPLPSGLLRAVDAAPVTFQRPHAERKC